MGDDSMRGQLGFFDVDDRLQRLSDLGGQLEAFRATVDFEMFRAELMAALAYSDDAQGGRPPFDPVMMFKILVIQAANNLSDDRTEFLVNDRLSFMRFLGLSLSDRVPDARTIWLFREKLTKAGAISRLFERFDAMLRKAGYIAMRGQIVDASLIAAPRQRTTGDEKKTIKEAAFPTRGRTPLPRSASPRKARNEHMCTPWSKCAPNASTTRKISGLVVPWRQEREGIALLRQMPAAAYTSHPPNYRAQSRSRPGWGAYPQGNCRGKTCSR
jgi:transposase, IS5 family